MKKNQINRTTDWNQQKYFHFCQHDFINWPRNVHATLTQQKIHLQKSSKKSSSMGKVEQKLITCLLKHRNQSKVHERVAMNMGHLLLKWSCCARFPNVKLPLHGNGLNQIFFKMFHIQKFSHASASLLKWRTHVWSTILLSSR